MWTFNQPYLIKPDKYELEVLVGEAKVEQPQGDLLPVDVVQENLPFVEGPDQIKYIDGTQPPTKSQRLG